MAISLPLVHSVEALEALIGEIGFLPLCACGLDGLSLQECTPPGHWFVRGVKGPWEWREEAAERGNVVYGKLFARKAGFVSLPWYAELVNWRRGGMDFDDRYADGLIHRGEKLIMDLVRERGSLRTDELRDRVGKKGFDGALASLQMRCDLAVEGFEYRHDPLGRAYGMGRTRVTTPERHYGDFIVRARLDDPPEASRDRMTAHMRTLCPGATEKALERFLR